MIKNRKSIFSIALIVCTLVVSVSIYTYRMNTSQAAGSITQTDNLSKKDINEENTESQNQLYSTDSEDGMITVISRYEEVYTMEQLIEESTLVISGTLIDSNPFTVRGVGDNLGEKEFTYYDFSVDQTLRGELPDSSTEISVRVEGNPDNTHIIYEDIPTFEDGKQYIMFLRKNTIGGGYNTDEEYYYIVGYRQGVFELEEKENILTELSLDLNKDYYLCQKITDGSEPISDSEIVETVKDSMNTRTRSSSILRSDVNDNLIGIDTLDEVLSTAEKTMPVDESAFLNKIKENYKRSFTYGFLTQEEYDTAIAELDQYADIVS